MKCITTLKIIEAYKDETRVFEETHENALLIEETNWEVQDSDIVSKYTHGIQTKFHLIDTVFDSIEADLVMIAESHTDGNAKVLATALKAKVADAHSNFDMICVDDGALFSVLDMIWYLRQRTETGFAQALLIPNIRKHHTEIVDWEDNGRLGDSQVKEVNKLVKKGIAEICSRYNLEFDSLTQEFNLKN